MKFLKPALTLSQQLQKWQVRGLNVPDPQRATHFLRFIGYYRLSAYALPFQVLSQPDKRFQPGTGFDQILDLYVFDRELRLLVMDAVERIEVAFRICLVNEMSVRHGPHWFTEAKHFYPNFKHHELLDRVDKELRIPRGATRPTSVHQEVFINHYYTKYTDPYLPPAWMIAETLSLGVWSRVYENLRGAAERKAIATEFRVDEQVLKSWLHALTYLRNLCAHHARLWNRQFVIKPVIARKHAGFLKANDRFYAMAIIIWELLRLIAPHSHWHRRLSELFQQFGQVPAKAMGFPPNWRTEAFWDLNHFDFEI